MIDKQKVIYGGKADIAKRIIEPTVMDGVSFDDAVMQEEIFGPILPVISYDRIDEVIQYVKQLPKPLSCYVFSKDRAYQQLIESEISFGGVGHSGIGSYNGHAGFKSLTHYKSHTQ